MTVLAFARLVLAGVFAIAGAAKLADRAGSRQALVSFGMPKSLVGPLGTALPIVELSIAVLLLLPNVGWIGVLGALVLLVVFTGAIAFQLLRGRAPDCHCFGQLVASRVGPATLVRNGALAALAAFAASRGIQENTMNPLAWLVDAGSSGWLALVALLIAAAEGVGLVLLLQQHGRMLLRLDALEMRADGQADQPIDVKQVPTEGLAVGEQAPGFALSGLYGETLTLDALRARGKPVVLLFSDPGCGPCNALLPEIGQWQQAREGAMTLAVISRGSAEDNRAKVTDHGLRHVLLQRDREVSESYRITGTPAAVIVGSNGVIGSPVAPGAEAIRALIDGIGAEASGPSATLAAPAATNRHVPEPLPLQPPAPTVGDRAPAFKLPDLNGKMVELAHMRGKPTLVLFWNPACGFCTQMLDELKRWEAGPPKGAPKLVIVSRGSVDENRALGLRSTVVLDQTFATARSFGSNGTPSAVLVDAGGRIASPLRPGAEAVMALARGEPLEGVAAA